MKRLLAVVAGGLGIGALLRRRRRRQPTAAETEPSLADELREKLAESRAAESEAAGSPAPEESGLEGRRREVHERARQSLDELS